MTNETENKPISTEDAVISKKASIRLVYGRRMFEEWKPIIVENAMHMLCANTLTPCGKYLGPPEPIREAIEKGEDFMCHCGEPGCKIVEIVVQ